MTTAIQNLPEVRVEIVSNDHLTDLDRLFATDDVADRCWCAWFCRPVKEFHVVGRDGNRELLIDTMEQHSNPIGLIAFIDTEPVGWCAIGERSRFVRAVKVPTLAQREGNDDEVWLVPCFYIRREFRKCGVATALLSVAIDCATEYGAVAIEGFPFADTKAKSAGPDAMVGSQSLFDQSGFRIVSRPSGRRVVMRKDLTRP